MKNFKLKKTALITSTSIIVAFVLVIVFISPITKYLVEKNDVKYSGREITMNWVYVNPFTGYVHFSGLKIYEPKSDSVFFSATGLSANFSMLQLFSKNYEITEIVLDDPKGIIIQHQKDLNFDDLIKRFTPKKSSSKSPVHFSILSIKINNGEFYYNENVTPVNYFIKKVNCECTGFQWNSDTIAGKLSFQAGKTNSDVEGDFTINYKTLGYRFAIIAHKLDLEIINQYLKSMVNYGTFRANIDANLKAVGNFKDEEDIIARGLVSVNDLHFGKDSTEDYASFDKLIMDINELSPKYHKYLFDSLNLSHPYFKYERYDHLDNLETMFGEKGSKISAVNANPEKFNLVIELARYVKVLAKNFFKSSYKINKLAINNGDFKFNDYSLNEKFTISAASLSIYADSIDKDHKRVQLFLKSAVQPYGNTSIDLSINPNDSSDFDMNCRFQKIPASLFNPYLVTYTSFPLDRGTIEFTGKWQVRNGFIQSTNHLLLLDPHIGVRIENEDAKRLPVPLIMAFIRERGNVIDYEIPISGNLKDPKFHWADVLIDLAKNIFVKPVTIPYGIEVKTTENEIEKSLTLKWELRKSSLDVDQEKFLQKMADFLKDNPGSSLSVYPICYADREREQILFFESKKKYFLRNSHTSFLTEEDSLAIDKMSVKDSAFVRFLDKRITDTMMFTIQQKCNAFVSPKVVDDKFNQLIKQRENVFYSYFKKNGVDKQLQLHQNKNSVPYNGFSYYKISYNGTIPEPLISAYKSLMQMNSEPPRKRYSKLRNKLFKYLNNQKTN